MQTDTQNLHLMFSAAKVSESRLRYKKASPNSNFKPCSDNEYQHQHWRDSPIRPTLVPVFITESAGKFTHARTSSGRFTP